jgi:hypothetical protein
VLGIYEGWDLLSARGLGGTKAAEAKMQGDTGIGVYILVKPIWCAILSL